MRGVTHIRYIVMSFEYGTILRGTDPGFTHLRPCHEPLLHDGHLMRDGMLHVLAPRRSRVQPRILRCVVDTYDYIGYI